MDKYLEIKKIFESREDKENAVAMSKYMRNMFDFYGLPTPKRKEVYNDFIKAEKKTKKIDWEFLDKCYEDNHREFQYLVYDYLLAMKQYVSYEDITKIKKVTVPYDSKAKYVTGYSYGISIVLGETSGMCTWIMNNNSKIGRAQYFSVDATQNGDRHITWEDEYEVDIESY